MWQVGHLQLPDRNRSIGLYAEKSDTWLKAASSHLLLLAGPKLSTFSWEQGSARPAREAAWLQFFLSSKPVTFEQESERRIWKSWWEGNNSEEKGSTTLICAKLQGVKNDLMRVKGRTVPGPLAPVFLCYLRVLSLSGSPVAGKDVPTHPGYLMWMAQDSEVLC